MPTVRKSVIVAQPCAAMFALVDGVALLGRVFGVKQ